MNTGDWSKRLEREFIEDGVLGGKLLRSYLINAGTAVFEGAWVMESRISGHNRSPQSRVFGEKPFMRWLLEELSLLEGLFHMEVHGARLTNSLDTFRWLEGDGQIPLLPDPDPDSLSAGMYINRSDEIGWMLLRSLPFMQLERSAFGTDWARKWKALDESFREQLQGVEQLGIRVATAFIHLLDRKFPFSPETTCYSETELPR